MKNASLRLRGIASAVAFIDVVRAGNQVRDLQAVLTNEEGSVTVQVYASSLEKHQVLRDIANGSEAFVYGRMSADGTRLMVTNPGIEDGAELDAKRAAVAASRAAEPAKASAPKADKPAAKPASRAPTASAQAPASASRVYTLMERADKSPFGIKGTMMAATLLEDGGIKGRIAWQRPNGVEECLIRIPAAQMKGAFGDTVRAAMADTTKTISARVRANFIPANGQNPMPIQALYVIQGLVPGARKTAVAPAADTAKASAAMDDSEATMTNVLAPVSLEDDAESEMEARPFANVLEDAYSDIPF